MTGGEDNSPDTPAKRSNYEVGYGKPPKEYQWRPGESGNKNGKPTGATSFEAEVRRLLKRKVPIKQNGKVRKVSVVQANFERLLHKAMEGDTKAILMIQELARQYLPEALKAFEELRDEDRAILARFLAKRASDDDGGANGGA
jgi:hypothetical protein